MTKFSIEFFEQEEREFKENQEILFSWCNVNQVAPLSQWLRENGYSSFDLFTAGLISTSKNTPSCFSDSVGLTPVGRELIAMPPVISSVPGGQDKLFYVKDATALFNHLLPLKSRSDEQARLDYRRAYEERYGYQPELTDDELPLKDRSYVAGPFCDLEKKPGTQDSAVIAMHFCQWCGGCISEAPSFHIVKCVLCYTCAKLAFQHIEPVATLLNDWNKSKADQSQVSHRNWLDERYWHLQRKGILVKIAELFGRDPEDYKRLFLENNPEPELLHFSLCTPNLILVDGNAEATCVNRAWVLSRDDNTCQRCRMEFISAGIKNLEAHHVIPKARGGKDFATNMVTLCIGCHDNESWFGHQRAFKTWGVGPYAIA